MGRNQLDLETSPYLLQHKDNPVHWMAWGPEALALARETKRPIMMSIGYAACHWCHVMAHESFEDEETARLMNDHFINIKVDREERPDLDTIYQTALALMGQHGGWPLTMFLTPEGEPFWGGTYFPREPGFGRPGFKDILRNIGETYHSEQEKISGNVNALRAALAKQSQSTAGAPITLAAADRLAGQLLRDFDPVDGGIGTAPKFPNVSILELMWRAWLRTGTGAYRDATLLALDKMCQGGIYDHLGGGFARYATDSAWLVPHFEKMLYDNAQLIQILTMAWRQTRSPLYATRITETVDWVLREMIAEGGGFASTLDADSEGEEGKFYVWTEAEIDRALGDDGAAFKGAYDVTGKGNWEGKTILNRSKSGAFDADGGLETTLTRCREKLLAIRDGRVRPGWDDKVLADWNGLMIAALANAGAVFGNDRWTTAAKDAFAFVTENMLVDGRLHHSHRQGKCQHMATVDDYAQMCAAALALHEATADDGYLRQCQDWAAVCDRHYWDGNGDGYFFTADDARDLITRTKSCTDNATPAGNVVMAYVLARLYTLTGKDTYRDRCDGIFRAFSGEIGRNAFPLATLINAYEFLERAVQIVIVGERADGAVQAFLDAVHGLSLPDRVITVIEPGTALPQSHPAAGKTATDGAATAYVCVGQTCSLPVTDPDALTHLLNNPQGPN